MKTNIFLNNDSISISGYNGAFLREYGENGNSLITGIFDYWYEACAVDSDENEYLVYWEIKDNYDRNSTDESDACNWDRPYMILDDSHRNVLSTVNLIR